MKLLYMIFCASAITILAGCQKVIDLDLKDTQAVIVIEANVTDDLASQIVKVTQTKPFTEDNSVSPILNATVTLKDLTDNINYRFGASDAFGNYSSEIFRGKPGNTYELTVTANNQVYTAKSTMPQKVTLDSLSVTAISFLGEEQKYIKVNFQDPAETANQYNYVIYINKKRANGYYVDFDRFNDGKYVSNTIFNNETELKSGDEVKVDFQCIDMNVYRYFFAISQIAGNGGPPTAPSNPDSNLSNGALGYFSAHTAEEKTAVIP